MLRQDFRHESHAVFQALVTKNGLKNGYCFQDEYGLIFGYAISRSRIWLYSITVEKLAISHCGQEFGYRFQDKYGQIFGYALRDEIENVMDKKIDIKVVPASKAFIPRSA